MNKILFFSLILDICDSKGFCKPSFSDALQSLVENTPTKGQFLSRRKCMTLIRNPLYAISRRNLEKFQIFEPKFVIFE